MIGISKVIYPDWYSVDSSENYSCDNEDTAPINDNEEFDPFYDEEIERARELRAFDEVPKHGFHAHAYNRKLDNLKMRKLRNKGYTYRQIAKQIGCSPSTVRNRLKKMGDD